MPLLSLIILALIIAVVLWHPWRNETESKVGTTNKRVYKVVGDVEFAEEPAHFPVPDIDPWPKWLDNGVEVSRESVGLLDDVQIRYDGLLKNSGADGVLLHCGKDGWKDTRDEWMSCDETGTFSIKLKVDAAKELNFCFKDTADHYDDNNGWNWRVKVD